MNNSNIEKDLLKEIKQRLDAILVLLLRKNISDAKGKVQIGEIVRFLHSLGFSPSEIAPLVGKKKATEIAPHLYVKEKKKNNSVE